MRVVFFPSPPGEGAAKRRTRGVPREIEEQTLIRLAATFSRGRRDLATLLKSRARFNGPGTRGEVSRLLVVNGGSG
jgi:hypothetical protein